MSGESFKELIFLHLQGFSLTLNIKALQFFETLVTTLARLPPDHVA
jgi:hypothetical protein